MQNLFHVLILYGTILMIVVCAVCCTSSVVVIFTILGTDFLNSIINRRANKLVEVANTSHVYVEKRSMMNMNKWKAEAEARCSE